MTVIIFAPPVKGRCTVTFSFDREVVETIKIVPSKSRSWNPDLKEWQVATEFVKPLTFKLQQLGHEVVGGDVEGDEEQPPPRQQQSRAKPPPRPNTATAEKLDWAVVLFQRVGPERIDTVFRALAKVLHPDVEGGDAVLTRQLIEGRDKVKGDENPPF